ncbi:MAG: 4'-phosphopantetheinyl transferase superfamily protein [Clostridia bacterium]|nr:4'-phosphopantetheinyl transferase superfamily protein [Clostridia bacterium]
MFKVKFLKFEYENLECCKSKREYEHNIAYSLLDELLKEVGINDYEFVKNENGKPFLKDIPIFFNISHTEGFCAVCINDSPIGIDCEKIDHNFEKRIPEFAKRYFLESELKLLEENGYDALTFFKIWTGKEAYIKKYGYNSSHITKVDTTKEAFERTMVDNYIITILK